MGPQKTIDNLESSKVEMLEEVWVDCKLCGDEGSILHCYWDYELDWYIYSLTARGACAKCNKLSEEVACA
jgi:hypothetical protein